MKTQYQNKKIQLQYSDNKIISNNNLQLTNRVNFIKIDFNLIQLYQQSYKKEYLYTPFSVIKQQGLLVIATKINQFDQDKIKKIQPQKLIYFLLQSLIDCCNYLPLINKQQILIQQDYRIKLFPTSVCTQQQFITNIKNIFQLLFQDNQLQAKINDMSNIKDLKAMKVFYQQKKQAKTINQLLQIIKNKPKSILQSQLLNQDQQKQILKIINKPNIKKLDKVYDGRKFNFDPQPLIKKINKQQTIFVIQSVNKNKIIFFMDIKIQIQTNSIFGKYYPDPQRKSKIIDLKNKTIYELSDSKNCVGFGGQMLLVIGRVDVVIPAFTTACTSHFPCSFRGIIQQQLIKQKNILGNSFELQQLQAYVLK